MSTLPATSNFGPALATFQGNLYIAWTPPNSEIHVGQIDAGLQLVNDHGLAEYSYHKPALTVFNNRLYIAWTGTDDDATLQVKSSQDGYSFAHKAIIEGANSADGPALAVLHDLLRVAWTGVDPQHSLNVISSQLPRIGGPAGLHFWDKQNLGQSSISAPALAQTTDDRLLIAWTAADKSVHLAGSQDGDNFDFSDTRVSDETSNDGPALLPWALGEGTPVLWFWWTGTDAHLNLGALIHPPDASPFDEKTVFDDSSIAGPSVATFNVEDVPHAAFIAWTGTDDGHHLNVKPIPQL